MAAFMTRYQQDLERKQKECKERFGCTQSGNCTHCGKYIQMDLGKHIAFCDILGLSYITGSDGVSYITGRNGLS